MSFRTTAHEARKLFRELLEKGFTTSTAHAKREMVKDGLTVVDVVNVIRGGTVEEPEWENGEWRYRIRTQQIVVVCELQGEDGENPTEIVVVTVWRVR